ncbi:MAG TPA: DUF6036 family nucleotidyltransferase [Cytophagaceae bacterium]|jgi:hypothetical protein|nr:DUF6036 family nucleotidyltransferase [Cytophagaceae bacterium]
MGKILFNEFEDFIKCLNKHNVEYILVGGYAVIFHGYARTTGDIDIWVNQSETNYSNLKLSLIEFGLPVFPLIDFLNTKNEVFRFGRRPIEIDIMTQCKGIEFEFAFQNSRKVLFDEIEVNMIDYRDLIQTKKSSGRLKDLLDIENLTEPDKD